VGFVRHRRNLISTFFLFVVFSFSLLVSSSSFALTWSARSTTRMADVTQQVLNAPCREESKAEFFAQFQTSVSQAPPQPPLPDHLKKAALARLHPAPSLPEEGSFAAAVPAAASESGDTATDDDADSMATEELEGPVGGAPDVLSRIE
jgi:hypothetical protein